MNEQLLRYFSGELTQNERRELLSRVENDDILKAEFIRLQNISAITELHPDTNDREIGEKSYPLFTQHLKERRRKSRTIRLLKYAAVGLILIASSVGGTIFLQDRGMDSSMNTLYVPPGQRAQVTLQDGTEVWLNAQSTLTYPSRFTKRSRKVELTGEAFFDVASNSKTFIVSTQDIEMHVLGTQFNVYSYPDVDYIQTDLIEGSLKIRENGGKEREALLSPNQKMVYRDNNMAISTISDPDHMLWKEGIYSFQNERLIDIIEKLQLYYDVRIIVEDPDIFNTRYTGKFRQRDGIDEILRILQTIQPFKIAKDRDNNIIRLIN